MIQISRWVADIVGLYLNPPEGAVVLLMDEKTQVQELDRTQPLLPMNFCKTEKRTHDYVRHGTTNLFAALNTKTGEVIGRCFQRRRAVEFLKFYGRRGCSVFGQGDPGDRGQPVNARRRRDRQVAEETFQGHISLHAQGKLLDKSGGNMVRGHHTASDPPRQFPVGSATRATHRQLHHPLERKRSTVHVDRDSPTAKDIIGKVQIIERDFRKLWATTGT
jgi:hypothetical protein